ncbi:hypothetical protein JOQ06_014844, partial [Pogonophryne albipinna]
AGLWSYAGPRVQFREITHSVGDLWRNAQDPYGKANAVTELQIQSTYKRRLLPRQSPVRYHSSFLLFRLQRWEPEVVGAIPIGVKERPKQPPGE